jgi:hypothetical protein
MTDQAPAPATSAPATAGPGRADDDGPSTRPALGRPAMWAAVVALGLWAAFALFLVVRSSADEVEWTRLAWVFASVEAVAFAGAGVLFGTTVTRQRAETAEAKAKEKEKEADAGRALAAALVADDPTGGRSVAPGLEGVVPGPQAEAAQVAARHARLARQFFPSV